MIVMQRPEGQCIKLTSDELDKSFGNPQMVDLFALTGGTVDLSGYYAKPEVDAALALKTDKTQTQAFANAISALRSDLNELGDTKADKATTYTKTEMDTAFSENGLEHQRIDGFVREVAELFGEKLDLKGDKEALDLLRTQTQIVFDSVYTKEESNGRYAKTTDNTQNLVANAVLAKGFAFGDTVGPNNPGLVYTDTNQGYGERLVLDTPAGVEYLVYVSDLEQVKARVDALEGKAAPAIDLSPYVTLVDADARYGSKAALDLLRSQTQAIFDGIYTREEADARYPSKATTYTKAECDGKFLTIVDIDQFAYRADVYTQKQCDDRFIRIDQAFSKIDFDNQMALFLYSRKQIDDRIAAINPIGSPSINDPALAAFRQSVLDEVKKLMAGGKTVPADIDWTVCPSVAGSGTIEARVLNGVIQLRGEVTITITQTGSFTQVRKLPANFPKPLAEYNSLVYGIQTGSTYRRVFVRWATNGDIGICPDGTMTAATLTGATAYAY
jgi:hypothetical protein